MRKEKNEATAGRYRTALIAAGDAGHSGFKSGKTKPRPDLARGRKNAIALSIRSDSKIDKTKPPPLAAWDGLGLVLFRVLSSGGHAATEGGAMRNREIEAKGFVVATCCYCER